MEKIAVINGVNLDRLGVREPDVYGKETLADLIANLQEYGKTLGVEILDYQSNIEGEIVNQIAKFADMGIKKAIINPAAFTHTSVAIRDCIAGSGMTFIEVHISNIYKREEFRHKSITAPVCEAVISGLGLKGYECALMYLANK